MSLWDVHEKRANTNNHKKSIESNVECKEYLSGSHNVKTFLEEMEIDGQTGFTLKEGKTKEHLLSHPELSGSPNFTREGDLNNTKMKSANSETKSNT